MILLVKSNEGKKAIPVLYLDLDGTVREGLDDPLGKFVNGPEDVRVFPEALLLMKNWKNSGGRIVGVSNQGGVALGLVKADSIFDAMLETQRQCEGLFDKIYWCTHHPDAKDPEFARCWCRKPASGLVIEAALDMAQQFQYREFYPPHLAMFVGDREEDRICAERVSIGFQWAPHWRSLAVGL